MWPRASSGVIAVCDDVEGACRRPSVGQPGDLAGLDELDAQPVRGGDPVPVDRRPGHRHLVVEVLDVQRRVVLRAAEDRHPALAERERRLVADVEERTDLGLGHREPEVVGVDRVRVPLLTRAGPGQGTCRSEDARRDDRGDRHRPRSGIWFGVRGDGLVQRRVGLGRRQDQRLVLVDDVPHVTGLRSGRTAARETIQTHVQARGRSVSEAPGEVGPEVGDVVLIERQPHWPGTAAAVRDARRPSGSVGMTAEQLKPTGCSDVLARRK